MIKPATRNVLFFTILLLAIFLISVAAAFSDAENGGSENREAQNGGSNVGEPAGRSTASAAVTSPAFSENSGFYTDPFQLSISCDPGCTVYYTLDGSDPDPAAADLEAADLEAAAPGSTAGSVESTAASSSDPSLFPGTLRYDTPLQIEDASAHQNVWSMRTDTSTGFYEDLILRYSDRDIPGYAAPDYQIDKCTILRAVAVDGDGKRSAETDAVYFVGKQAADYDGCNIISIVTDPSNLFDAQKGIYVTGNRFAHYLTRRKTKWYKWDANYYMSGKDSERDARICLFDPEGKIVSDNNCAIRISGNVTRAYNQKSFSVFLRDADGEPVALEPDIFGTGFHPEELILSSGGQNPTTKFNSYAASRILGDRFAMKHYSPAVVFLDGEYWGFYWITERYDPDWFAYYLGVDRDDIVAVKFDGQPSYAIRSIDPLTREQESSLFEETEQFFLETDLSDPDNYAKAGTYFDLDDFIDYYAIEVYLSNYDWPARNKEFWRTWEASEDSFSDGRWRCLLYDLDLGMDTSFLFHANALQRALDKDDIFSALWKNAAFRKQFKKRLFYYADNYFSPDSMDQLIDSYSKRWSPALEKSWRRFFREDVKNMDDFNASMKNRKKFFRERRAIAEDWFR